MERTSSEGIKCVQHKKPVFGNSFSKQKNKIRTNRQKANQRRHFDRQTSLFERQTHRLVGGHSKEPSFICCADRRADRPAIQFIFSPLLGTNSHRSVGSPQQESWTKRFYCLQIYKIHISTTLSLSFSLLS
eukprot:Selendium_serpulae@DN3565_c0_g1_i1.p1